MASHKEPDANAGDASGALAWLARRVGIEPHFVNAMGETVVTPAAVQSALLTAMGFAAADEREAEARLAELDAEEWSQPLRPVVVLHAAEQPARIPIALPPQLQPLRWTLAIEAGETIAGELHDGDSEDGVALLCLHKALPCGYHRLTIAGVTGDTLLIVTPGRCFLPPALENGARVWGIAAQLYLLRSEADWGIGGYGELEQLADMAAGWGADVVGVNPLHAMFFDDPEQASPYSPASRLFLNILNIDPSRIPGFAACAEAREICASADHQRELVALRARRHVGYRRAAWVKDRLLWALFRAFRDANGDPGAQEAFARFRRSQGEILERFCLFQVLHATHAAETAERTDWRRWAPALRDPGSAEVQAFAAAHRDEIDFLAWAHWVADEQLAACARRAEAGGMAIGLYRDLAVGADAAGAESWANPTVVVAGAHAGAPPDIHNPAGQDWGLPPFDPRRLRAEAYASFIALLRANMRHAGALRIDHVVALQHLYWVPAGQPPASGAYVRYPMEELIGILALESHRHQCLVIGEDLGTVPEGFRERMTEAAILSYRVLPFEQDAESGALVLPAKYPYLALATFGSHDLPTLRGWWQGRDIVIREQLDLYPEPGEAGRQRARRRHDRAALIDALGAAGIGPTGLRETGTVPALGVHRFLARSRAAIAMVQVDDLTDEADQVNLPTTTDEHPNWRRRQKLTIEELADDPGAFDVVRIMQEERPRDEGGGR